LLRRHAAIRAGRIGASKSTRGSPFSCVHGGFYVRYRDESRFWSEVRAVSLQIGSEDSDAKIEVSSDGGDVAAISPRAV
jgi:hypothetical protein